MNTNCLQGVRCPKCGQEDTFEIAASVIVTVTDGGIINEGDTEYGDDAPTACSDCGFSGPYKAFVRQERNLARFTDADAETVLGRPITESEYRRIVKALEFSSMSEAFSEVVFACADPDPDEPEDPDNLTGMDLGE